MAINSYVTDLLKAAPNLNLSMLISERIQNVDFTMSCKINLFKIVALRSLAAAAWVLHDVIASDC